MKLRIGQSTDIHQLIDGSPIILGGIEIESDKKIVAHSDGDILIHAITEALIGALAMRDLGNWFSDEDESEVGRDSYNMLRAVYDEMIKQGYSLCNIDSLILIEKPILKNHIPLMKEKICRFLDIDDDQLNIKVTRGEKIGFVGRREGIVAQAIALIEKNDG